MKVSELNINKLVISLSILRETENYLRDTTDINKAVSGRKTIQTLDERGGVIEKLISLARQGSDEELSAEDEEVVKNLSTYYSDTLEEVMTDKAIPEGEELLVLPKWDLPRESGHADTYWGLINVALLHAVATKTNDQADIKAYLDYLSFNQLPKGFPLTHYTSTIVDRMHKAVDAAVDQKVTEEFGAYLNVKSWKEMGNAIEGLVNRVNAKDVAPSISELTLSLDDFDRIGAAVDAMYGTSRVVVRKSARADVPNDRPVPHYTRVNSTRKANVVLVLKAGKIDGVSFTGF